MPKGAVKFRKALSIGLTSAIVVSNTPIAIFANENTGVKEEQIQINEETIERNLISQYHVSNNKGEIEGKETTIDVDNEVYFRIVTSKDVKKLKLTFPNANWSEIYDEEYISKEIDDKNIEWIIKRTFKTVDTHTVQITPITNKGEGESKELKVNVKGLNVISECHVSDNKDKIDKTEATIDAGKEAYFKIVTSRDVEELKLTFPNSNWSEIYKHYKYEDGKKVWIIKRTFKTVDTHTVKITPITNNEEGASKELIVNVKGLSLISRFYVSDNKDKIDKTEATIDVGNEAYFKIITSKDVRKLRLTFPNANWSEIYDERYISREIDDKNIEWIIKRTFKTVDTHTVKITPITNQGEGASEELKVNVKGLNMISECYVSDNNDEIEGKETTIDVGNEAYFRIVTSQDVEELKLTFPNSKWSEIYKYYKHEDGKKVWIIKRTFKTVDTHIVKITPITNNEEGTSGELKVNVKKALDTIKVEAINDLNNYVKQENYSETNWKTILNIIEDCTAQINDATNEEEVNNELQRGKAEIDIVLDLGEEEALNNKKAEAIGDLESYKQEVDYSKDKWEEILGLIETYKTQINNAKNAEEVDKALADGTAAIDQVQNKDQELDNKKEEAINDLNSYVNKEDYSDANWKTILGIIEDCKAQIEAATNAEDVDSALQNGKAEIDAVLDLSEETEILNKKKLEAINDLNNYAKQEDYSDANWKTILGIIEDCKAQIEAATNAEDVDSALQNGKAEIGKVPVKTEKEKTYEYFNIVKELIPKIGLSVTLDDRELIENIRFNFEKINYKLLDGIEAWGVPVYGDKLVYVGLREALELAEDELKSLIDADNEAQEAADKVIALIDAIGEVGLSNGSFEKIDAARNAYEALSEAAQNKVIAAEKLIVLEAAEERRNQLAPILGLRDAAKKEIETYKNLEYYNNESKEAINKIIADAKTQIDASESEEQIKAIVEKAKSEMDKFENNAATMRNNSIEKFETLKAWKANLIEIKENMNDLDGGKAIAAIIDIQIGIVQGLSIDIDEGKVRVGSKQYTVASNHETYTVEKDILEAIDKAISRAEESDKLIDGELSKVIDQLIGDGISINIGKSEITGIAIPQGLNKENTIEAITKALTVKDFVIDINGTMNEIEIPTDKVDMKALENLLKQSESTNSNVTAEDIIEIIKALPALKLNIDWNTDGFSNKVGEESKVVSNITIGVSLGDLVNLATNPSFENIINSLLEDENIDLTLIKYVAEYLNIDLNKYNVGLGYKVDFVFDVKDISINTTTNLGTLKLPVGIDSTKVNDILKSLEKDFVQKIIDLEYSGNAVEISISSQWDEYTADTTQLTGVINVKLGDIVLSKHTIVLPIQHVDYNEKIESELENLKQQVNDYINNSVDKEQVKQIIAKLNELKEFIKNNPNLRPQ